MVGPFKVISSWVLSPRSHLALTPKRVVGGSPTSRGRVREGVGILLPPLGKVAPRGERLAPLGERGARSWASWAERRDIFFRCSIFSGQKSEWPSQARSSSILTLGWTINNCIASWPSPAGRCAPFAWQDQSEGPRPEHWQHEMINLVPARRDGDDMCQARWFPVNETDLLFELGETSFVQVYPLCRVTDSCVPSAGLESHVKIENRKSWSYSRSAPKTIKKQKAR